MSKQSYRRRPESQPVRRGKRLPLTVKMLRHIV